MKNPVVYAIFNQLDGKAYIGSSIQFNVRSRVHRRELIAGRHKNCFLQSAWNKHGGENFVIAIIEHVAGDLIEREQFWIDSYEGRRYNLCPKAGRTTGSKQSEETKAKRSVSLTGKKRVFSEEHKANLRAHLASIPHKPFTEEQKARCRAAQQARRRAE